MKNHRVQQQQVAVAAVRSAARVCQAVQQNMVSAQTLEKKDRSPVTVADFAAQSVVCAHLQQQYPGDAMISEEDAEQLRQNGQETIRRAVVEQVSFGMGRPISDDQALGWINWGSTGHDGKSPPRFWTLDPIDGTKGFLRGGQYAVALALVEGGEVTLGLLGCPNLPIDGEPGALFVAQRGEGVRAMRLWDETDPGQEIRVSDVTHSSQARFCESVESAHSSHGDAAKIAQMLGITAQPVRMDSQAKYATLSRGDASIYLRLPTRADYIEKIWDHAAGWIVVTEAGGRVTDVHGKPLAFTHGSTLKENQGIVATNGPIHDQVVEAVGKVLGN